MSQSTVYVKMLGSFSLSLDDKHINDTQNRSKKVWGLLAYLLYHHNRVVTQGELIDLFWSDDDNASNPVNSLKTTIHRLRAMLSPLTPEGGHALILNKDDGYTWNSDVGIVLDCDRFEQCCKDALEGDPETRLALYREALELYTGEFLSKMSSATWIIPLNVYYHNLYISAVSEALELLEANNQWETAEKVCRSALQIDPYQESFYQHLMQNLLAMEQKSQAIAVFENMSKLLLSTYGVMPNQESRRLYRLALRTVNHHAVPVDTIREQLREETPVNGALICDYDFFKTLYHSESRRVARTGSAVHLCLLSLSGKQGKELSQKSLETAMDHLQEILHDGLRQGDVVARCSPSQFIVMLPQANYEDSCMVCQRELRAFSQKYPHSAAAIEYLVYALEPARKYTEATDNH